MATTTLLELIIVGMLYVVWGIPLAIVLERMGFTRRWAILSVIPGGIVELLWCLAFAKWPAEAGRDSRT